MDEKTFDEYMSRWLQKQTECPFCKTKDSFREESFSTIKNAYNPTKEQIELDKLLRDHNYYHFVEKREYHGPKEGGEYHGPKEGDEYHGPKG